MPRRTACLRPAIDRQPAADCIVHVTFRRTHRKHCPGTIQTAGIVCRWPYLAWRDCFSLRDFCVKLILGTPSPDAAAMISRLPSPWLLRPVASTGALGAGQPLDQNLFCSTAGLGWLLADAVVPRQIAGGFVACDARGAGNSFHIFVLWFGLARCARQTAR